LGEVFVLQKKNDLALEHFHQAEKLFSTIFGMPNPYPAQANLKIAQIHENQEQWEAALLAYHKVLLNTIHNYKDNSIWSNPNNILAQGVYGKLELLTALQGKTRVYFALHRAKPDLNMLERAKITSRLAIQLIDSIRSGLFLDTDRLFQTDQHYAVYEQAIEIAQELRRYAPEKEKELQGDIFRLIEKSKGLLLQAVFNRGMSENWNDPKLAQIQEEERQWKYILAQYEAKLQGEKNRIPANLQNEYLGRLHEFHNWMQKAKTTNPEYYQRKYEPQYITLQKFQQQSLQPQQALIEYYWGERKLTTLVITQNQVRVYQQEISPLQDSLKQFQQLMTESVSSPLKALRHRFNNLSHHLYMQLLAPALKDLGSSYRQLSIVRDGPLEYLPFELLDVAYDKSANEAISAQEFLVNRYPISYAHSATLLHEQKNVPILPNQSFFAAFAPSFPKQASNNKVAMRLGSYNLPAAQAEAFQLSKKIVGGRLYKDDRASERSFKLNASRYAILHLPLHAFADDESPESSELLFTQPNPDSMDDGHFKAWELYGVQLKAQMVVLSACQTGRGKLQRGEGALSLAYAFFNAGVPSIVSSQWNAKDLPTSRIMENFYRNLKQGMSKAEALQKGKIEYLKQGDPHPFYWAHLIISGNEDPIKFPITSWFMRHQNQLLIYSGLFAILFIVVLIFKGRFQK
jgi:CHAT domain-containing protein